MITFKIVHSASETINLKTRSHEKTYTVHECCQSHRIGYVMESIRSFDKEGTLFKATQSIKSFYFGFPNSAQADKFEDFAKYKFPELARFGTDCEARLSKRLKTPFEVKIRNLSCIKDELSVFFSKCIEREMQPTVVDMPVDHDAMRKKVARF
jgi:hypothetical protein